MDTDTIVTGIALLNLTMIVALPLFYYLSFIEKTRRNKKEAPKNN